MSTFSSVAEVGFGVLFLVGAGFNTIYTSRHGDEFYGSFAASAWLRPARNLIERFVIPNAFAVTAVIVMYQLAVALMILLRGELVQPGLWAGAGFALMGAAVSSPGGAVANLALAAGQLVLAFTR